MQNRLTFGSVAAGILILPLATVILLKSSTLPWPSRFEPPAQLESSGKTDREALKAENPGKVPAGLQEPDILAPIDQLPKPPPVGSEAPALNDTAASAPDQGLPTLAESRLPPEAPPSSMGAPMALSLPAPSRSAAAVSETKDLSRQATDVFADGFSHKLALEAEPGEAPAQARDRFAGKAPSGVTITAKSPVSTFSIDTDTASYAWVRRMISGGSLPAPDQVRIEEMVNYFPYDYALPADRAQPFRPTVSVFPTPWNAKTKIVHIGIKGYDTPPASRPVANLVFLVDTSGSMNEPDKLPLVRTSLKMLVDRLQPNDSVGLVTYAGSAGVALEPTKVADRERIIAAIDGLGAAGSTAGAAGIETAYALARKSFVENGVNRVFLATDGDFNVGPSDDDSLTRMIETERKSGVFLSVLGFGQGNYNDALMQRLAQNGNGTAAYIDRLEEAQKVLVDESTSTLFTVAKDVKIQVEFNPAKVAQYRLVGYETRLLNQADFNNDRIDAGEVGSGTTVTALYEITPVGSEPASADALRYGGRPAVPAEPVPPSGLDEYGFLKIRYKLPNEASSHLISQPIAPAQETATIDAASEDARFAAAVAAFGQKLKQTPEAEGMSYDAIIALAEGARGVDLWGYRSGFVTLARLARSLAAR